MPSTLPIQLRVDGITAYPESRRGLPPAGVALLDRWTTADLGGGFGLLETDDVAVGDFIGVHVVPNAALYCSKGNSPGGGNGLPKGGRGPADRSLHAARSAP
ncbi:hypothetical protein EVC45_29400 [Paraburkholderia sp. UYCP14C]|uniref:DUF3303 domain-containing protein n=1 Tax=Paraburkholderia sp. UYCP14C TaxID=2511130 RepID=UPI00101E9AE6|nr:DUF3303 family protein [Paraburkholderia sp. UYCP14C]RZF26249.1 hypothetical protein EVC45_29400 [Paraburkholderia sp. UYCP14C]